MNTAKNIYKFIQAEPHLFDGAHDIFTPQALVERLLDQVDLLDKKILVVYNIEFVISLVYTYKVDPSQITFYADHENKIKLSRRLGVKYITQLDSEIMKKFDVIVGNPPYQDKKGNEDSTNSTDLAAQFVRKSFENSKQIVALVIPSDWTGPNPSTLKNFLFNEHQLKSLSLDGRKWFKVDKDTCTIIYDKNYTGLCEVTDINGNTELIDLSTVKLLSLDNKQTTFIHKFNVTSNLGSRWLRGSLHLSSVISQPTGTEFICAVGQKDKPMTVQTIAPGIESTGLGMHKVVVPNVGEEGWIGNIKIGNINQVGGHSVVFLITNSDSESKNLKAYLESKVIRLLIKAIKKSTPNSKALFTQIPDIPLNKQYTDAELYAHFNLTQTEIDYIESNSK